MKTEDIKAVHLEGGNYFDNMQIDISASHHKLSNLTRNTQSIKKTPFQNLIKLWFTKAALRSGIYELFVVNGVISKWFTDFHDYWSNILNGRPLTRFDFFMLLHDYRKQIQYMTQLTWNDPAQHVVNWQNPPQIFLTFLYTRKFALNPTEGINLLSRIPKGSRVLEYGCSLAPYYHGYREFFSHLDCTWILADIPNFPFHYAKYLYRNDAGVDFVTIDSQSFADPLGEKTNFDAIILTTVFEHLDDPLFTAKYLLERLRPGGIFIFDYIKSEGIGLDHPNAVKTREDCLKFILEQTQIIDGKIDDINQSVGLCVARKK
jgi:SAM-dependent methyltransferase